MAQSCYARHSEGDELHNQHWIPVWHQTVTADIWAVDNIKLLLQTFKIVKFGYEQGMWEEYGFHYDLETRTIVTIGCCRIHGDHLFKILELGV